MNETNEVQVHPALMEDVKLSSEAAEHYRHKAEEARLDEEAQARADRSNVSPRERQVLSK